MSIQTTTEPITDITGRYIAPPQVVFAPRPAGPWDDNAFAVWCAWCQTEMRAGNPALPKSHGICPDCTDKFDQETA